MKFGKLLVFLSLLVLPLVNGCGNQSKSGTILFADDFENGSLSLSTWKQSYPDDYPPVVTSYGSGKALKFTLGNNYPIKDGSTRCEIGLSSDKNNLAERWYAFKIYLPDDYTQDSISAEVLAQWHGTSDKGEPWTVPSLRLMTFKDSWYLGRHYYDPVNNRNVSIEEKLTSYTKNTRTDWVFHVRWGWNTSHRPLLEIYKDGSLIYTRPGASNTTNDRVGVFFKMGIYKSDWAEGKFNPDVTSRTVYHDDFKMGDANCQLSDFQ